MNTNLTFDQVLDMAQHLKLQDQLRLMEALIVSLKEQVPLSTARSILELQGLGKEIWRDVDAQEYVRKERAVWNG